MDITPQLMGAALHGGGAALTYMVVELCKVNSHEHMRKR